MEYQLSSVHETAENVCMSQTTTPSSPINIPIPSHPISVPIPQSLPPFLTPVWKQD